jgi:membrane protease YdiL (CAAX protease family)
MPSRRPPDRTRASDIPASTIALLAGVNVIARIGPQRVSLLLGPPVSLVLVRQARRAGLEWADLGLNRGTWRRGARWAAAETGLVATGYAVVAAVPALRPAFRDKRHRHEPRAALVTAVVVIPAGTVLLEEVAFRGVLWGWLQRAGGTRAATMWSSVLFGLWHVAPSLGFSRLNEGVGAVAGHRTSDQLVVTTGAVVVTGLAGIVLAEVRRRSGSLLAPFGLHWAANGIGVLGAAAAWWIRGEPEGGTEVTHGA